ncbi:hypothetical protein KHP62_20425 [Rhodobacteraceae bacterium NNCM2]|nr:hypothetical protein [Coraliihabitans acroporae]
MQISDIKSYANQMFEQTGPKAIAIAAQKARALEDEGNTDEAETWRKIEEFLLEKRGAHQG